MSENNFSSNIGKMIHLFREKQGISQAELALKIGMPKENIQIYETDPSVIIPFDEIEKIVAALDIPIDALLCQPQISFIDDLDDENDLEDEDDIHTDDIFFKAMSMFDDDKDALVNTGFFNSYIEGYMMLALKAGGYPTEEIDRIVMLLRQKIFLDYTAKMAREVSATDTKKQTKGNIYHFPGKDTNILK